MIWSLYPQHVLSLDTLSKMDVFNHLEVLRQQILSNIKSPRCYIRRSLSTSMFAFYMLPVFTLSKILISAVWYYL